MRTSYLAVALFVASAVGAQSSSGAPQTRVPTATDSAVMRALDLPSLMQRARSAGIPDSTVRGILDQMRRRGVPVGDALPAFELEVEAVEQGGVKNNFGSFVRAQVESGLRGQELAAAIRAERERRGMGPGNRGRGGRDSAEMRGGRRPAGDSADKPPTRGKRP